MKHFTLGQKVIWDTKERFAKKYTATITAVESDHAIATTDDGMNLWIDEDTEQDFR